MFEFDRSPVNRSVGCRAATVLAWSGLLVLVCCALSSPAGAFQCGDLNDDDMVTANDLICIVNYVFKSGAPPEPLECADVNHDYAVTAGDAVRLVDYIFRATAVLHCPPEGVPVTHGGCKPVGGAQADGYPPPDEDCLVYHYDGTGTISMRHLNAGFNCCPSELCVAIERVADTIRLIESEHFDSVGGCFCLCLFDLQLTIEDIAPGQYVFTVVEPYLPPGDDPLIFTAVLPAASVTDTQCVNRSSYPWVELAAPTLQIVGTTGCKTLSRAGPADTTPANQDCALYQYDLTSSVLQLEHLNAGFNCCPIIGADISVAGNVITITEHESPDSLGFCDCLCLFDVHYEISGLSPGQYMLRFEELYLDGDDQPLEFPVDLVVSPEGSYCVSRDHYPWGF